MDRIGYAQSVWDCEITERHIETEQALPEPCCEEMAALLTISNGAVEAYAKLEEYHKAMRHPEHAKLRKQIMNHVCEVSE